MEENKDIKVDEMKQAKKERQRDALRRYRQNHPEANKDYSREWYQNNKERHLNYLAEKIQCNCGKLVSRSHRSRHERTQAHLNNINNGNARYVRVE